MQADAEVIGELPVGPVLSVFENEELAVDVGQAAERRADRFPSFLTEQPFERIAVAVLP